MDLFHLEAFLAVAREGSFSAAARALYRTQPAVSQIIKRLEDEVGQPLFDRSSRRGVLTDAGRVLLEHAERLVNLRGQALAALDDVRRVRAGRLTVLVNELTGIFLLPYLHEFRRLYPGIQITVQRSLASRIPAQVRDFAADLGVVTYQPSDDGLRSIVVYRDELVFVVPPGHPLAARARASIGDLGSESFIAHHVASPYRQRVIETFRRRRVTLQMPVEMPTLEAVKRFVAMGNGVALLPAISVADELARGELAAVRVPELSFERSFRIVLRRGATLSQSARAFLKVVESARRSAGHEARAGASP
jgi:DNA-binding transcriptional LysR family regulator